MEAQNSLCKVVMVEIQVGWRYRLRGYTHRKPAERVGSQPRRGVLQSAKLKGIGDLKSPLTVTHGDADFGVCPAGFYLVQYLAPFLPFGMVMYILCYCML